MRDRRQGILTDTGQARRWNDKLFGFIVGILLVFLVNWVMGCSTAPEYGQRRMPAVVDCSDPYFLDDFRCQIYMPEPDIEYDQSTTEAGFEDVF